jgi:general secretion pathway protein E
MGVSLAFWSRWTDQLLTRALRPGRGPSQHQTNGEFPSVGGGVEAYVLAGADGTELSPAPQTPAISAGAVSAVPVIHWVDRLLTDALAARASDIHLEDETEYLRVRYRIDGLLEEVEPPPDAIRTAVIARFRVMAGLNLAENRRPQDGRMRLQLGDRTVDIRVSTVPVLHGESVALRLLDPRRGKFDLADLGMLPHDLERLEELIRRPHGMLLSTGPGGSGKSTTLFSIVRSISSGREKIFTVEDPVEYDFEGICQVQVNYRSGLTFPSLLRSLVRQDPDVLLVGEIRDAETADIAVNAALTGHLLLSTLHTTDAISAMPRLLDLGVPDYLIVHTLEGIVAQRLVRRICPTCAIEVDMTDVERAALGPDAAQVATFKQGVGCDRCQETGYLGRTGLYELLIVDDTIREAFLERRNLRELRSVAIEQGMRTLRLDGIEKIRQGITTPAEVIRVT